MCDRRLWRDLGAINSFPHVYATINGLDRIDLLARNLLDTIPGPIVPIGFSMGAIVALMLAKLAPERVLGLILSSTNCTADLPERSAARLTQQAQVRGGDLEKVVRDELKPHYLSPATQGERRRDILDLTLAMGLDLGPETFLRQSEALRTRPGLCDVLGSFAGPSLIIAGSDDTLCPPAWHMAMAARHRRASYVEIADAGHLVPLEQPAAFTAAIEDWLVHPTTKFHQEINA